MPRGWAWRASVRRSIQGYFLLTPNTRIFIRFRRGTIEVDRAVENHHRARADADVRYVVLFVVLPW
jgi:hypothetical protein